MISKIHRAENEGWDGENPASSARAKDGLAAICF
jgi:hypothetical protein